MFVGSRIRDLRAERNLSLRELAERAAVSSSYLSAIERGLKKPSLPMLRQKPDEAPERLDPAGHVSTDQRRWAN
ncbi:helix-turn-helix domain-containing protein [Caldinitratiruptor microaerophilus]|uniref:HTH cro/C1-type domain-containing protein n=1 Tax=Caldinitratiruptor microaerophilus TaxID=671077 RepID=A0AA35G715_9FIRM|nr:helix-turn-helix transcriptional regulator [Caldinitratiruptor microaerophilus]BDG59315.1 hypothetical protein caldi_04050 [Caldinitratiruptor microaerophilus]